MIISWPVTGLMASIAMMLSVIALTVRFTRRLKAEDNYKSSYTGTQYNAGEILPALPDYCQPQDLAHLLTIDQQHEGRAQC